MHGSIADGDEGEGPGRVSIGIVVVVACTERFRQRKCEGPTDRGRALGCESAGNDVISSPRGGGIRMCPADGTVYLKWKGIGQALAWIIT